MDRDQVLRVLDAERQGIAHAGALLDVRPAVTRIRAADGSHHRVVFSSLRAENADAIIDEEVAHYRQLGVVFEWKAYAHDAPPDLLARLERRGFEIGEREAVMVYDLTHAATWIDAPAPAVVRVDCSDRLDDYRRVAERVFGKDYAFTTNELAAALATGSPRHRGYVAYVADGPASIGRLYTNSGSVFGGLCGGGTLPACRGLGLYRAVVAARARDARAAGARYLLADALPTSQPILERLGFERVTDTWPCEWRP